MNNPPALHLEDIERRYVQGEATLVILCGATLAVWPGESVALIAPSGAGKSTLLHIAGLLEQPDAGEVYVGGRPTSDLADSERTGIRRTEIGFVYQFHHLLPEFSAVENVMLPQMIHGLGKGEARQRSCELLRFLGLGERLQHRPGELSGGEQQRVAIARTLMQRPALILADEPVSSLDPKLSQVVLDILKRVCREDGITALVSLHTLELTREYADRVIGLRHGEIVFDGPTAKLTDAAVDAIYHRRE
jgi:lipoprotein-releasing system ATP-binding protein